MSKRVGRPKPPRGKSGGVTKKPSEYGKGGKLK